MKKAGRVVRTRAKLRSGYFSGKTAFVWMWFQGTKALNFSGWGILYILSIGPINNRPQYPHF